MFVRILILVIFLRFLAHEVIDFLVIAQEHGTVVFPGLKEQIILQTVADDDIMDAPAFEIMNHSIRIAVPFREQQLF